MLVLLAILKIQLQAFIRKEIKFIGGAVDNPKRPFVAILGGAKVSIKFQL